MNPDYLDNSTEIKARRNLLIAAASTLLFANLRLESNKLEVLGLRFVVETDKIVGLGQIVCLVLLSVFLLRLLPRVVEVTRDIWSNAFAKREHASLMELRHDYGFGVDQIYQDSSPEADFQQAQAKYAETRAHWIGNFDLLKAIFLGLASLVIDVAFPLTLGFVAVLDPYAVSTHLLPFALWLR